MQQDGRVCKRWVRRRIVGVGEVKRVGELEERERAGGMEEIEKVRKRDKKWDRESGRNRKEGEGENKVNKLRKKEREREREEVKGCEILSNLCGS